MSRKKSGLLALRKFETDLADIEKFLLNIDSLRASDHTRTWAYEHGVIRLYRAFESLVLELLVTAINNDSSTISSSTNTDFPKHMKKEVCEYLVTAGGYFDFKGHSGLIKKLLDYVPKSHWLVTTFKISKYQVAITRLSALRNFAAHGSPQSRKAALSATGQQRLHSAGAWLKSGTRMQDLITTFRQLSTDLAAALPY